MNRFRRNKYKAVRTANGFPSKLEAALYDLLLLKEKAGEITNIKRQHSVVLQDGPKNQRIAWKVDFSYLDLSLNETVFAEAKGVRTNDFLLKLKLWRKLKPYTLLIYGGSYKRLVLTERIDK